MDNDLNSVSSGDASVILADGTVVDYVNSRIPNQIGTSVMMPRHAVEDNAKVGCSTGLHVGSYSYANSFSRVLIEVRVDPANVVSVPSECAHQKMRVCLYEVVARHDESKGDDLTDYEPAATYDDEEAWEAFAGNVPQGFLDRLKDRLRNARKGGA